MKGPRKPLEQCYNCIDFDPGILGWIFDFFARWGWCMHKRKKDTCAGFKLAPHFWDQSTRDHVKGEYED